VSVAPVGSTGPTTSTSALDGAFVGLGYVSEDGVTKAPNDTAEQIVAWQNAAVVRTVFTESFWTFQLTLIETKGEVVELYYKGSTIAVVSAGEWKVEVGAAVTERGDMVFASGEPIGFDITITAYADADGVAFTEYSDDAAWGYS
jgi:hypothetical protein